MGDGCQRQWLAMKLPRILLVIFSELSFYHDLKYLISGGEG